ncbi:endoglucanase 13 [Quercus suber]|uniref:Endoglucanase n=1 Tax=Quercus suber TaxID=58331 RepID=A0AAW0LLW1_QUESU
MSSIKVFSLVSLCIILLAHGVASLEYGEALTKSLLFYEGQRSGKLPSNQRVQWRGDSALKDGSDAGVDLVGGYYDAGDNVKFGFPFAFTITMLSWSTIEFQAQLEAKKELSNALDAIKWGTDYLIKAHPEPNVLYAQLFDFARNHQGVYQSSIPQAGNFYSSSGFEDELLWAAAWLHRATDEKTYLDFLGGSSNTGGTRTTFSWDDKYVGAQVLVSKLVLEGKVGYSGIWSQYKSQAEQFICSCAQKGNSNVKKSPGGLLWFLPSNNLQYTTSATFIATAYSQYLTGKKASIQCLGGMVQPDELIALAKSQVDYILGANPQKMSYMVGFGSNYPKQLHHRGASIVSIKKNPEPVTCKGGFELYFNKNEPNPNVLDGAVVGGPDDNDGFTDSRSNFQQAETATANIAPLVGVLARIA